MNLGPNLVSLRSGWEGNVNLKPFHLCRIPQEPRRCMWCLENDGGCQISRPLRLLLRVQAPVDPWHLAALFQCDVQRKSLWACHLPSGFAQEWDVDFLELSSLPTCLKTIYVPFPQTDTDSHAYPEINSRKASIISDEYWFLQKIAFE